MPNMPKRLTTLNRSKRKGFGIIPVLKHPLQIRSFPLG